MTWLAEKSAAASEMPAITATAPSSRASRRRCHGMCGTIDGSAAEGDSDSCIDHVDTARGESARLMYDVDLRRQPLQHMDSGAPRVASIVEGERPRVVVEPLHARDWCDDAERA